jgi:hypothetical protein
VAHVAAGIEPRRGGLWVAGWLGGWVAGELREVADVAILEPGNSMPSRRSNR